MSLSAGSGTQSQDALGPPLPLSVVRRIMCLDEDVSRVSSDAVKAVAWGIQHFLELLAGRTMFKPMQHDVSSASKVLIKACLQVLRKLVVL